MSAAIEDYTKENTRTRNWLRPIPTHWDVRRNGRLFRELKLPGRNDLPILTVSIHDGVAVRDMSDQNHRQMMENKESYQSLMKGDIAYNMMRMWQGAVGVAPVDGLVSPAYVCARPYTNVNPKYYEYLFRTPIYMGEVEGYSRGIVSDRNRLYWEGFKQIPTPHPPIAEQDAIVAFLDHKLEEIDRFIANKRGLLNLLEEEFEFQLACLITSGKTRTDKSKAIEFVEKGTVNDSSWTYISPESWNRKRIKLLAKINPTKRTTLGATVPSIVSFVPMEVANARLPDFEAVDRQYADVESGFTSFRDGDVLIAKITPCFENGKGGICRNLTNAIGFGSTEFHVLRPTPAVSKEFLYYATATRPFRQLGASQMQGAAGQQRVPTDFLKEFILPFPSKDVQKRIVAKIEERHRKLIDRRAHILQEILLMNEFRTSLITEAVTGEIAVQVKPSK